MIDWLTKIMDQFKQFIMNNADNPFLWLGFFLIGLALAVLVMQVLNKND